MRSILITGVVAIMLGTLCTGCSSVSAGRSEPDRALIEAQYTTVEHANGISREEAVIIAQHYMLTKGHDYDWFVGAPIEVTEEDKSWTVTFEPKEDGYGSGLRRRSEVTFQMLLPYWVTVRKDTGEISTVVVRTGKK